MIFNNPYWSVQTKLDLLARWIIVHSIIYYELGTSIIEDKMFDDNARQYVSLAWDRPDAVKQSRWGYIMHDFDGATGFDLYGRLKRKDRKLLADTAWNLVHKYGDASALVTDPRQRKSKIKL